VIVGQRGGHERAIPQRRPWAAGMPASPAIAPPMCAVSTQWRRTFWP
jgi:hypothetical protein